MKLHGAEKKRADNTQKSGTGTEWEENPKETEKMTKKLRGKSGDQRQEASEKMTV